MKKRAVLAVAFVAAFATSSFARAAELSIYATGSMAEPLRQLGEEFTRTTGNRLTFELGTTGVVLNKLKTEKADVIFISAEAADALEKAGRLVKDTRTDIARSLLGVAVKRGAKAPDIATAEAFKQAVVAAHSLAYPDPKLGATSGVYIEALFKRLNIDAQAKAKTVVKPVGADVADAVAKGEVELGLTFLSELVANQGVAIVGPFPDAIQNPTLYTAGVAAESTYKAEARAFIAFVTTPTARAKLKALGVDPAANAR